MIERSNLYKPTNMALSDLISHTISQVLGLNEQGEVPSASEADGSDVAKVRETRQAGGDLVAAASGG